MSDDPKLGNVLLFGGSANAEVFNDCWVLMLSGATYILFQVNTTHSYALRHGRNCSHSYAFNAAVWPQLRELNGSFRLYLQSE
jgi:hypothetical protein